MQRFAWDMLEMSAKFLKLPENWIGYDWSMPMIGLRYIIDMLELFLNYAWEMTEESVFAE